MHLYIYGLETDFTDEQESQLRQNFAKVELYKNADYAPLFRDPEPKVIALDPDVTGWNFTERYYRENPEPKSNLFTNYWL